MIYRHHDDTTPCNYALAEIERVEEDRITRRVAPRCEDERRRLMALARVRPQPASETCLPSSSTTETHRKGSSIGKLLRRPP